MGQSTSSPSKKKSVSSFGGSRKDSGKVSGSSFMAQDSISSSSNKKSTKMVRDSRCHSSPSGCEGRRFEAAKQHLCQARDLFIDSRDGRNKHRLTETMVHIFGPSVDLVYLGPDTVSTAEASMLEEWTAMEEARFHLMRARELLQLADRVDAAELIDALGALSRAFGSHWEDESEEYLQDFALGPDEADARLA